MKITTPLIVLALLCGCSRFKTIQLEERYTDGKLSNVIKTKVTAGTFFDARSALANFKASQTEKNQGASVGTLSNDSNGTNAVAVLQQIAAILNALPK